MDTVEIGGLHFGEGLPKICVPLTASSVPALISEIQTVRDLPADLFEWRADGFFGSPDSALTALREGLGEKPVLCTVRTVGEGGKADLSPGEYEKSLEELLERGGFQLLDIELFCGEDRVRRLVKKAREKGIGTVISRHDFQLTPGEDDMVETLLRMKELGGDLPKLAVMPQSPEDLLRLLSATLRASSQIGPVITVSMGALGKLSRVSGQVFGSCLTFGSGQQSSAPGQMNTEDLRAILEDISPLGWEARP